VTLKVAKPFMITHVHQMHNAVLDFASPTTASGPWVSVTQAPLLSRHVNHYLIIHVHQMHNVVLGFALPTMASGL